MSGHPSRLGDLERYVAGMPKKRTKQFVLAILLGASCLIAATLIWNPFSRFNQSSAIPPIDWRPFTRDEANRLVADGHFVLLFGKPIFYTHDGEFAAESFNDPKIRRLVRDGHIVPMILEYDDWSGREISAIFQEFGHTKYAIAMLFAPNREPVKLDPHSADDILKNIHDAMSLGPQ